MTSIYLDQNIYGNILDEQPTNWLAGEIATLLLNAQRSGTAEIWVSPTHVIETAQTTNSDRRQMIATVMLELTEARRMWWGHEFEAVSEFFMFLRAFAPDAIRWPEYFDQRADAARRIWLGALALLAACPNLKIDSLVQNLAFTKATSRLRHARFAADPDRWIDEMIETVEQRKTTNEPKDEFAGMSLEQMQAEIDGLLAKACKLGKKPLQRLNKHRETVARGYGAMEIGGLLPTIFTMPMEMSLVFDIPHIVERWPEFQKELGCASLPDEVRQADYKKLAADPRMLYGVIQHAIYAASGVGLVSTTLSFQVVLRDIQKCINDKAIPTGGLVFDAGHAAALKRFDIFMTADMNFADSLKTMAGVIEERSKGQLQPDVVMNAKQLSKALQSRSTKSRGQ